MPKFQCEKCGALFAGWGTSDICPKCGGKLKRISWEKYYEEKKRLGGAKKGKLNYVK